MDEEEPIDVSRCRREHERHRAAGPRVHRGDPRGPGAEFLHPAGSSTATGCSVRSRNSSREIFFFCPAWAGPHEPQPRVRGPAGPRRRETSAACPGHGRAALRHRRAVRCRRNEELIGEVLGPRRDESPGQQVRDDQCGRPAGHRRAPGDAQGTCDAALQRLRTDHIDLYYLHRWDKRSPSRSRSARWPSWSRPARSAPSGCPRSPPRPCAGRMRCTRSRPCRPNTRCGRATRNWERWSLCANSAPPSSPSARWPAASSPVAARPGGAAGQGHPQRRCRASGRTTTRTNLRAVVAVPSPRRRLLTCPAGARLGALAGRARRAHPGHAVGDPPS